MAAQEDVKHKGPAAKVIAKAPPTAASAVASEMSLEDLGLSTNVMNPLTAAGLKTVQDLLDKLRQGGKIPGIAGRRLGEIHQQLAEKHFLELEDEEAEVERESQAQGEAEQARAEPERAPAEAGKAIETEAENTEPPSAARGEKTEERPVSFRVRVTVDEQGKPLRTEIQPAKQDKEPGRFPGLDGQELTTYMERYISALVTPEPVTRPAPPPARAEAPAPGHREPAISLTVSDVQVSRAGVPGVAALVLSSGEAFVVQTHFRLGPEALSLTAQEPSYELQVYAREVTSGTSALLATDKGSLARDALEYPVKMQASGLAAGLYRLLTLVTLGAPVNMLGHREGPIIHVAGVQPFVSPVTPLKAYS
jgi:hypothetical protein